MTSSISDLKNVELAIALVAICVLGVAFNVTVIVVVAVNQKMRGSTDLFMVNLAVSDILLAGLALPLKLNTAFHADGDFHGGDIGCKVIQCVLQFTIMCSVTTMVSISFDRLFAITRLKTMQLRNTSLVIAFIWILSLATSAPQLYEYSIYVEFEAVNNETHIVCGSHGIPQNFQTVYAIVIVALSYLLPLVLIAVNYVRIVIFLHRRAPNAHETVAGQGGFQVSQRKTKTLKLLACLTSFFVILWLPYFVLFTIEEITDTDHSQLSGSLAHSAKHLMIAISTTINPVLYCAFHQKFRDGLCAILSCSKNSANGCQS